MTDGKIFFGAERGCDVLRKSESLHDTTNDAERSILMWFYGVLNILDAKANGLMRVNSSFVTILLFFFGLAQARIGDGPQEKLIQVSNVQMVVAGICLVLALAFTFLCFLIVRVSWKFLGHVQVASSGGYDFKSEVKRLANVVDDRTHYYLIGWYLTLAAAALPLLLWIGTAIVYKIGVS